MVHRRLFWPLVAVALVFAALAGASFATAVFSAPVLAWTTDELVEEGWTNYVPLTTSEIFGRPASLSWSQDWPFLVAAIGFVATSVAAGFVAARACRV